MARRLSVSSCAIVALAVLFAASPQSRAHAKPPVPGTGVKVTAVGDDFEDPAWGYVMNGRKASHEQDEEQRPPGGKSHNGRWYESAKRGQPDIVRRIATPPGGIQGSAGSLFLCSKLTGIPGEISGVQMQDDLLMGIATRLGRPIPVQWQPNVVVRVYLPEFERWENRSGSSFGIRADVRGRTSDGVLEPYWPGMFLLFRSETNKKFDHDFAEIAIRARNNGSDQPGPVIEQPGWWTFGLSFTPDGQVHQYASPGVDDLTEEDHLYSSSPYGMRAVALDNFFVNVANREDGKTWSTPWVIDDPAVYVVPPKGHTVEELSRRDSSVAGTAAAPGIRQAGLSRFLNSLKIK